MATRSLTESFVFMRRNAQQNRQFFHIKNEDSEALVSLKEKDLEKNLKEQFPPECENLINSLKFEFDLIRNKMADLMVLHDRHYTTTNIDDKPDETQEIELQTKEITELFTLSHRQISKLSIIKQKLNGHNQSQKNLLVSNVINNLARTLKELSFAFRKSQAQYLEKLKNRDERIKSYLPVDFGFELEKSNANTFDDPLWSNDALDMWQEQKQSQKFLIEENTKSVAKREEEINQIVSSIQELNDIFRDVAQLVVEQGTLVDRIDYNVELTSARVDAGLQQLSKAQSYQKKDRKMIIIIILAMLVLLFGIILITTKFRTS